MRWEYHFITHSCRDFSLQRRQELGRRIRKALQSRWRRRCIDNAEGSSHGLEGQERLTLEGPLHRGQQFGLHNWISEYDYMTVHSTSPHAFLSPLLRICHSFLKYSFSPEGTVFRSLSPSLSPSVFPSISLSFPLSHIEIQQARKPTLGWRFVAPWQVPCLASPSFHPQHWKKKLKWNPGKCVPQLWEKNSPISSLLFSLGLKLSVSPDPSCHFWVIGSWGCPWRSPFICL